MSKEVSFYPKKIENTHPKPIEFMNLNSLLTLNERNNFEIFSFEKDNYLNRELQFLRRLKLGYSLNIETNIQILSHEEETFYSLSLIDVWEFIQKCESFKGEQNLNKDATIIDPSQGFMNILKLHKEEESGPKMIQILNNQIYETKERLNVLKICGWSEIEFFKKEENSKLKQIINDLTQKNQHFRAAAISIFHYSFDKAQDILTSIISNKSHKQEKYVNEIHYLRGLLSGFYNIQEVILRDPEITKYFFDSGNLINFKIEDQGDFSADFSNDKTDDISLNYLSEITKIKNKKQKIDMLKTTLNFLENMAKKANFEQPYLQLIANFLSQEIFQSSKTFMKNKNISFFDRFAILIRFSPPSEIISFFNSVSESLNEGIIEHIFLFGNKYDGSFQILSSFLDISLDIQTVGLMACHLRYLHFPNEQKLNDWFRIYKELLTQLEFYEIRSNLDKDAQNLKKIIADKEKSFKGTNLINDDMEISSISQRCYFCFCSLSHCSNIGSSKKGYVTLSRVDKSRIFNCPDCLKPLPNCAICLLPVSILNPYFDVQQRKKNKNPDEDPDSEILNIDEAVVWCQTCRHGGHYKHIVEWFMDFPECPVSDCQCECTML